MKRFAVFFVALLLTATMGCDGDGDGDGEGETTAPSGEITDDSVSEDGTEDGTGDLPGWMEADIPPGEHPVGSVVAPGTGTLHAEFRWDAPPEKLGLWLKQTSGGSGETTHRWVESPMAISVHVHGGGWSPYVYNNSTTSVHVRVYLYFLPD